MSSPGTGTPHGIFSFILETLKSSNPLSVNNLILAGFKINYGDSFFTIEGKNQDITKKQTITRKTKKHVQPQKHGQLETIKSDIEWEDEEFMETLEELYLPEHERFYRRREIDTRKLNFEYYWIDLREAARKENREQGMKDRSVFIKKDIINVYPDTLAWIHDFTYSFNEPMTNMYFWHPAYDDYPVVGVTWKQARAFCIWRTQLLNSWLLANDEHFGVLIN